MTAVASGPSAIVALVTIELVLSAPIAQRLRRDAEILGQFARRAALRSSSTASRRICTGSAGEFEARRPPSFRRKRSRTAKRVPLHTAT